MEKCRWEKPGKEIGMEDQKKRVYDALDRLKIKYEVVEHEPVHTMKTWIVWAFRKKEPFVRICF